VNAGKRTALSPLIVEAFESGVLERGDAERTEMPASFAALLQQAPLPFPSKITIRPCRNIVFFLPFESSFLILKRFNSYLTH
jgi:hypothetical protein